MNYDLLRLASEIRIFNALLMKLLRKDQEARLEKIMPGMTGVQLGVLRILRQQSYTLKEISEFMQLSAPTLVPVVDKLERQGYILRVQDPRDRRRNRLVLEKSAFDLLERIESMDGEDVLLLKLVEMNPQDAQDLNRHLQELVERISPQPGLVAEVLSNLEKLNLEKGHKTHE